MTDVAMSHVAIWSIAAAAVAGIVVRPGNWSEAWWAVGGALALVCLSLIAPAHALAAVAKGTDVYLFLTGMMLIAELARRQGVFDWLAAIALGHARGSAERLFFLIYAVGTIVAIFLSNDATAVVLTPAVCATTRRARVAPLPFLLICAFIANAASFVLPISNPANLVVFGQRMPPLEAWLKEFGAASVISIVATYALLHLNQRHRLAAPIETAEGPADLSPGGRWAVGAIAFMIVVLIVTSIQGWQLGLPTFAAAMLAWVILSIGARMAPWPVLEGISWNVLPLVAGLFVLVEAVAETGATPALIQIAARQAQHSPAAAALMGGGAVAFGSNLINNLPMGLMSAGLVQSPNLPPQMGGSLLIGVDLGPNLSITGSLATILWLAAIRREGEDVRGWQFLAAGSIVMPLSLGLTLVAFLLFSGL